MRSIFSSSFSLSSAQAFCALSGDLRRDQKADGFARLGQVRSELLHSLLSKLQSFSLLCQLADAWKRNNETSSGLHSPCEYDRAGKAARLSIPVINSRTKNSEEDGLCGAALRFALVGYLLGGTVGMGSVICAFVTGPAVQLFMPLSRRLVELL